jgi:TetR/AcrR family transcriptional regulator, fatty acid metabolism regulator protein
MARKREGKQLSVKQINKRNAIVQAAIDVFSKKGFHRSKISDIAKLAKVADGTVYLYFKNKDDLLMKTFESIFVDKLHEMQEQVKDETTAYAKVSKFFDLHVEMFRKNPAVVRFLAIELWQSTDFYKKYPDYWPFKEYLDFLRKLCEEGIADGSYRQIDPTLLSYMMFGTMDFLLTVWVLSKGAINLDDMRDKVFDIFRFGIRNQA